MSADVPRMRVLVLPHPEGPRMFEPWATDVLAALTPRHDVAVLDPSAPLGPQFADVDVVVDHGGASGTREMADLAGDVRLWQILGTGFDHFDLAYWRGRGIPVANCPGTQSAVALAECALMLLLMLSRRYPAARANLDDGRFYEPVGRDLEGLRLCIVGFGSSGRELARRARAFDMTLSAIDVVPIDDATRRAFGLADAGGPDALDDQLAVCDAVSLHLHLDASTRHLIDAPRLARMRPGAWLVNVARGELVDETALVEALSAGRLGGAGLDVFADEPPRPDSPLLALESVVATPHIAGVTAGTSRRRAETTAANVDRVALGLEPLHRIDLPTGP